MLNINDFESAIAGCLKDPDQLVTMAEALTNSYKEALEAGEAYKTKVAELETTNNKLRDDNVSLVLKVLHNGKEEEPEITREQRVAELTNKFLNNQGD